MADLNWSLTGTESEVIRTSSSQGGVIGDINDDDVDSARSVFSQSSPYMEATVDFDHIIDFVESVNDINKVELISSGGYSGVITVCKIYLYYSSSWNEVFDVREAIGSGQWTKRTEYQTGNWSDVTKIKLVVYGGVQPGPGLPVGLYDFELRAWGPPNLIDIGIRVRAGGETLAIGTQEVDVTHKLRIRKGGTTYGIPLIATGGTDDSGVRIYDGSSVKTIPKI